MKTGPYQIEPYPRSRQPIVDYLSWAQRKHVIHALLEVDVTVARQYIREHKASTGEKLSFTAFIIACLARAVDENKTIHAYRLGRSKLLIFEDVDVDTLVERQVNGQRIATPHTIRAANRKTFIQIHAEIRAAQVNEAGEYIRMDRYGWVPNFVVRYFWRLRGTRPHIRKRFGGTVSVTSVSMFGSGVGWGIPITDYTLQLTLGGIAEKPGVVERQIEIREYLSLTMSFDHDVVDGAPAARFAQRLKELIESTDGLID